MSQEVIDKVICNGTTFYISQLDRPTMRMIRRELEMDVKNIQTQINSPRGSDKTWKERAIKAKRIKEIQIQHLRLLLATGNADNLGEAFMMVAEADLEKEVYDQLLNEALLVIEEGDPYE